MTEVRWLNTREQSVWRGFLTATGSFMEHLDRQMQRDSGMPLAYFEILAVLSEMPDRSLRMSELAEMPDHELDELTQIYQDKGLTPDLAPAVR
ncbi:hypothetical protein ACFQ1S_16890 [Kibdelosporangium lantanae]|uniref:MarR family transcriptional regulator n=1 Tax=Kibdelosporangium lantanae TaxID=1497396 RepID=A0ABW3M925_9PSEU